MDTPLWDHCDAYGGHYGDFMVCILQTTDTMVSHSIMQCETTIHGHMISVYGQSGQ